MNKFKALANPWLPEAMFFGIFFLFLFQLISEFVEGIYVFGLLGTSIPAEIVSVLFFFSPLLLLFVPGGLSGKRLPVVGYLMLAARLLAPMLDTRGRMLVSGLGVSSALLFLPGALATSGSQPEGSRPACMGAGLALAVALANLLRAFNSGVDLSLMGWGQSAAWLLALPAGVLLYRVFPGSTALLKESPITKPAGTAKVIGLSVGIIASLVLLYFGFTSLNVIARWTGLSYRMLLSLGVLGQSLAAAEFTSGARGRSLLIQKTIWAWNVLFIILLALTILLRQAPFPQEPGAYPFYDSFSREWPEIVSSFLLLLSGVITIDFYLMARELADARPSWRLMGSGFGLGALFILLMVFGHVFTTVYDYIPMVGPFFRDRFWLVYLVCSAAMALPLLLVRGELHKPDEFGLPGNFSLLVMLLALVAYLAASTISARPQPAPANPLSLRVFTYNIQQGYSESGQRNYDGQLEVLRAANADLIGLQESDTNRIAGGNADLVRYLADRLDMVSYYGPSPVVGTFGIALLSRYPIENPQTFFMYSQGEQTAAIAAQVTAGSHTFNVFVTHLGNSGPLVQQQQFLQEAAVKDNVIAMGDFNFRPDTEQYRLTTASLLDAWLLKWPDGQDDQGINPTNRIDHIFLSESLKVMDAQYWIGPASDHPAVLVEVGW